jgi:hypothetical protein
MGAHATGSKLDGLEGARVSVVGAGLFVLRWEMVFSVDVCGSEGDGDVVKEECLGVHADSVTLCMFEGIALDEVESTDVVDVTGPKVKTGTVRFVVLFVVLLGHIAMPSTIQATFEVGHVNVVSAEGKGYTDGLSVSVVVTMMVLVFSAAVALRLVVSCGEEAAQVSSAKRLKFRQ